MTSSPQRYSYSALDQISKQVAISELNENPIEVNAHIESFRRWIKSMKYITCPLDSQFLLQFLRIAKFDHRLAQKRLDNFCTVRSSTRGAPELFKFFSVGNPILDQFLRLGMQLPLGRINSGELIVLVRPHLFNPASMTTTEVINCFFMGMDQIISEEETQIHGIKFLVDLAQTSHHTIELWANPRLIRKWHMAIQDSYPIRNKGQIFYNEPIIFDIAFQMVSFFMNEKSKARTVRVKEDIQRAIGKMPGLEKILPKEYHGQGGLIDELGERWQAKVEAHFKEGNRLAGISVDESKRPRDAQKHLADYGEYKGPTVGTSGTYTKFENMY